MAFHQSQRSFLPTREGDPLFAPPWSLAGWSPAGEDTEATAHSQFPLYTQGRTSSAETQLLGADFLFSAPICSGILSMIIIRTLRKDIANYNKEDDMRGLGWGGWTCRGRVA